MNLIDIEDRLKDLSDQQLMQQMQRPDGTAPQFLVMSELKRRKEMRDKAPAPETTTVKDDLVQQGIASVANQMAPQDGIPRFSNGMFPGTNIAVRPTAQDYARYLRTAGGAISQGMSGPNTLPKIFDRSSKGMTVNDVRRAFAAEPMFGGDESAGDPRLTSEQIFNPTGARSYDVQPRNLIQRQRAPGTDPDSMLGDVTPPASRGVPGYAGSDIGLAPRSVFASGPQMSAGGDYVPIDPARRDDFPDFGMEETGASSTAQPQNASPAPVSNAELNRRYSILGGSMPGQGMPGGAGSEFDGEVNAATDYGRAVNQIMSAPSSAAPAAPPTNYYEGIEKKLAALQEAETGPDTGMALLRAGLGIAQAGGEGKSTAAAIGAGGIAGLDAYEADKKAKQARQMQLMGVESQLAGAKTQQAYNQQKLALDARMRDNQDKMLQLKGLGMSMDDDRIRALAANQNQLKFMGLQLQEQKINFDADYADRKLRQMVEEGKIKGDYYEALTDKANRGDSLDRYINATPEVRQLILPILRKNNASLQGDIGESAMKLMDDPLWVEQTRERLKKEAGGRKIGINAVVMEARRLAELGYGQGGGAPQAPKDPVGFRR
jgi:hypothetical protein